MLLDCWLAILQCIVLQYRLTVQEVIWSVASREVRRTKRSWPTYMLDQAAKVVTATVSNFISIWRVDIIHELVGLESLFFSSQTRTSLPVELYELHELD